jgi:CRP-like cAMP-binding protein
MIADQRKTFEEIFRLVQRTPDQMLTQLEDSRWGRFFDYAEMDHLVHYFSCYQVKRGQDLFQEGDRTPFMFMILKGLVRVTKEDEQGDTHLIGSFGISKILGEMSLIDGEPRSATCTAEEDLELMVLSEPSFRDMKQERPKVALRLVEGVARTISRRLRKTSGDLMDHIGD